MTIVVQMRTVDYVNKSLTWAYEYIMVPGLLGAIATMLLFSFAPELYWALNDNSHLENALNIAFDKSFGQMAKMFTPGFDTSVLSKAAIGFFIVIFVNYLYKAEHA